MAALKAYWKLPSLTGNKGLTGTEKMKTISKGWITPENCGKATANVFSHLFKIETFSISQVFIHRLSYNIGFGHVMQRRFVD